MRGRLYKFQRWGVKRAIKLGGRVLLGDDMGLGKTPQTLAYIQKMPHIRRALIFCPATAKWHWQREAWNHFRVRSSVLSTRTPDWELPEEKITIINYDIVMDWEKALLQQEWDMIVLDECHECSNVETKRYQSIEKISDGVLHVFCLSGTPMTMEHGELWGPLHLIRPDIYHSRLSFGLKYTHVRRENGKYLYKGSVNGKKLFKELRKTCLIRRTKKEVLKDLPSKTREVIPLELEDRIEYDLAERDFKKWVRQYNPDKASKRTRTDGRVQLGYLIRIAARLKLPQVKNWINNFFCETEEKLIMYAVNRVILEEIEKKFHRCCTLVYGKIVGKKRQDRFDLFNTDDKCRLMLGNIKAAGSNWSAKSCWNVAFCQFAWKPGLHVQAEDRCLGLNRGQGMPVTSYYLVAHDTVESDMCELLQSRQRSIDTALDGGKAYKDFDIWDKLISNLREKWL